MRISPKFNAIAKVYTRKISERHHSRKFIPAKVTNTTSELNNLNHVHPISPRGHMGPLVFDWPGKKSVL